MFYLCWHVEGEDEGEGEEEGVGEDKHGGVHVKPLPLLKFTGGGTGATPDTAALQLEAEGDGCHQGGPSSSPHTRAQHSAHFSRLHTAEHSAPTAQCWRVHTTGTAALLRPVPQTSNQPSGASSRALGHKYCSPDLLSQQPIQKATLGRCPRSIVRVLHL